MGLKKFVSSILLLVVLATIAYAEGDRVFKNGNLEWMMTEDANGQPQLMILSGARSSIKANIVLRENVTFQLYTRENSDEGHRLYVDENDSLEGSGFNPDIPTKILVHGFGSSLQDGLIQTTKYFYFSIEDCNVIGVGYGPLASGANYIAAKEHAIIVGRYLGELISFLVSATGANTADFHLIGHSLGGQVIGNAGPSIIGGLVSRMSALDPALPLFGSETDENRLDPTDATLVDVIHTDGGALGFLAPCGHVDFYPNGGKSPQPGCGLDITGSCSHGKSVSWFMNSVLNRDLYEAVQCDSFEDTQTGNCTSDIHGRMGDNIGDTPHGIYYLEILPEMKHH